MMVRLQVYDTYLNSYPLIKNVSPTPMPSLGQPSLLIFICTQSLGVSYVHSVSITISYSILSHD